MRYYPINLDIKGQDCLVVGGGGVGTRKVKTLAACGANVTVVSPAFSEKLTSFAAGNPAVTLIKKAYETEDMIGKFLVFGATDNDGLNEKISRDAKEHRALCNIADFPEACNFILPSVISRGDLVIAISTSGKSPAVAKRIRMDLDRQFGEEYTDFLVLMGAIRKKLLAESHAPEKHKSLFEQMIAQGLLALVKEKDEQKINALLSDVLGEGYRYEELMVLERHDI